MPRYLVEFDEVDDAGRKRARSLATERFPEIEIEIERSAAFDLGSPGRELWECRAPSDTHLRRWAAAAGFSNATTRLNPSPHEGERP
jgi:hypothetical protein